MSNKSFAFKSRVQNQDGARKELQEQIAAFRREYDDLKALYEQKARECERMEMQLKDIDGELGGEAQALQDVCSSPSSLRLPFSY